MSVPPRDAVPVAELRLRRSTGNILRAAALEWELTAADLARALRISPSRARAWFEGLGPLTAAEAEVVEAAWNRWERSFADPIPGDPTFGNLLEIHAKSARLPRFC